MIRSRSNAHRTMKVTCIKDRGFVSHSRNGHSPVFSLVSLDSAIFHNESFRLCDKINNFHTMKRNQTTGRGVVPRKREKEEEEGGQGEEEEENKSPPSNESHLISVNYFITLNSVRLYHLPSLAYRGGIWEVQTPPKFRSFDKAEPNSLFRRKYEYIRNNLIRIRVSLICKLRGTPDYGLPPQDPRSLCPLGTPLLASVQ
jgi:hypothetical protein